MARVALHSGGGSDRIRTGGTRLSRSVWRLSAKPASPGAKKKKVGCGQCRDAREQVRKAEADLLRLGLAPLKSNVLPEAGTRGYKARKRGLAARARIQNCNTCRRRRAERAQQKATMQAP